MPIIKIISKYLNEILIFLLLIGVCSCDNIVDSNSFSGDKMFVYANNRDTLYVIDINTFELSASIPLIIPGHMNLSFEGPSLSVDNTHLLFNGYETNPPFAHYILSFQINQNKFDNVFKTGFEMVSAPRIFSAQKLDDPGLVYFYSNSKGLFSFDFIQKKLKDTYISNPMSTMSKEFYVSRDKGLIAVKSTYEGDNAGYSEIQCYNTRFGLSSPENVLNKNNIDKVYLDDLRFSDDGQKIFVSYMKSGNERPRDSFIGYYDLNSGSLHAFPFELPWGINPYYIAYNSKRNEIYTVGSRDNFYIIDAAEEKISNVISLTDKLDGPARITINNDGKIAFVSCPDSDFILVIDLEKRCVIKKILLPHPYFMIIP